MFALQWWVLLAILRPTIAKRLRPSVWEILSSVSKDLQRMIINTFSEVTMKITRIDRTQAQHDTARANYFDGEVNTHILVGPAQSNELDLLNVYFSAGARTRPHIHEQDQVLHIIEGLGIVATDAEKESVTAGDVITIPAGTWHWHGATRHSAMAHISIMKRGKTNWTVEENNWATGYDE